jgi:hypothetical protein
MEHDMLDALRSSSAISTNKVQHLSGESDDNGLLVSGLDDFESGDGYWA